MNSTNPTLARRLLEHGAASLSPGELLALLMDIAPSLAEQIMGESVQTITPNELEAMVELDGDQKARLLAALELGRRLFTQRGDSPTTILSAADAAHLLHDMADLPQEHVRAILLDNLRHVIEITTVYIGTVRTAPLRPSEVYREAIGQGAVALILAHNHPSGDPTPSPEDVEMTRTLAAAGRLLDIPLLDHLIIGRPRWLSLREMGLTF